MIFLKDLGANFGYHSSRRYSISGLLRQNGHLLDINNCRKIITVLKVSTRLIRKIQMPARHLKLESGGGCLYCSVSDVIKFPPIFNLLSVRLPDCMDITGHFASLSVMESHYSTKTDFGRFIIHMNLNVFLF